MEDYMSCHDIGSGLNSVSEKILELFEQNKITKDVAIELLLQIKKGVYWCDGNENEAVEALENLYCGICFEKKNDLIGMNNINGKISDEIFERDFVSYSFCKECLKEIAKSIGLSPDEIE